MKVNREPFVSIIIPAFNEARYIQECLSALRRLDYPGDRFEIIIVDNGSVDETVRIAKHYTDKIFICPTKTIGCLRNFGVRQAAGEIYAFIDADCVADKDWLKNAVNVLKEETCVTGSKYDVRHNAVWIEKAWFGQRVVGRREVPYINSGNLIVPATLFHQVGGFDETLLTGEDSEFCQRAKKITKVISDHSVRVVHLGNPLTMNQFLQREIWHGIGALGSFRHTKFDKPLLGTVAFLFLTLFQIAGLVQFLLGGEKYLFTVSSAGVIILLLTTVLYRMKSLSKQTLQLFFLYYLFYVGRSISIYYLIMGRNYRRTKQ